MPPGRDVVLGPGDLRAAPTEVHRPRTSDRGMLPRHRTGEHEVDLRDPVPVGEPRQHPGASGRQPASEHLHGGPGRRVEEVGAGAGQRVEVRDRDPDDELATVRQQVGDQDVRDRSAPATRDRPPADVCEGRQHQGRSGGDR
ncbi:hypothetical protein GALL_544310 [mine drainage metagenome]|uniref:Uncharacterized protein n=1 Tax=mine drainage metagenome TaxID=410659 RepID=A0A1J5NYY9_9ZZZZ